MKKKKNLYRNPWFLGGWYVTDKIILIDSTIHLLG